MQKINTQNLGLQKEYDTFDTSSGLQLIKPKSRGSQVFTCVTVPMSDLQSK